MLSRVQYSSAGKKYSSNFLITMVIRHDFHQRQRWVTYKCYLLCCPSLVQDAIAETAKLLVENVFRLHGIPVEIVSERGPQFTSQVWKVFCIALWAKLCLSSGYHLQTNRQTERLNQEFEITLRCVSAHNPTTWSTYLSDFVHHRYLAVRGFT